MRFIRVLILSVLISLSCSYVIMSSVVLSRNEVMTGADLMEEIWIALLLGLAIGCASLIFQVERLVFSIQLLLHFIMISFFVYFAGYFGNWYDISQFSTMLFVFGLIVIVYSLSWLIIRSIIKSDVQQLNEVIKQKREGLK